MHINHNFWEFTALDDAFNIWNKAKLSNICDLATVVLHESRGDVELVRCSRVFTRHLEHRTSRFDALGATSKPHVLYIRLSTYNSRYNAKYLQPTRTAHKHVKHTTAVNTLTQSLKTNFAFLSKTRAVAQKFITSSSWVWQHWAWAPVVSWAVSPWVKKPVLQWYGTCRSCLVRSAKKGIWTGPSK